MDRPVESDKLDIILEIKNSNPNIKIKTWIIKEYLSISINEYQT